MIEILHRYTRAVLYRSESATDLRGADLSRADLSRANLYGANLYGADLSRANLYGADLYGAEGVVELPVADPRGYRLIAIQQTDGDWLLTAGCRGPWTIAQCRDHWGASNYNGDPLTARHYLRALDWWESEADDYRAAAQSDGGAP